ncbi:MAG: flagellar biosynthetic protein FliR [Candidatus Eisenbacteria sp.]|nr:flagellar biosynthetic protein FliR [Candidatus Eisenbacteria bacterium]
MEWMDRVASDLPLFLLTGVRVAGLLFLAPVFGQKSLPPVHRIWMVLLLSLLLLPAIGSQELAGISGIGFVPVVASELAVGLLLGFSVLLFLESAKFAGRLAGVHIGFGLASIVDPVTKEQGTLLDQLQGMMVLVLFVTMGGHRMLLQALGDSYSMVPIGQAQIPASLAEGIVRVFCRTIVLGIQIAMPVLASVFLTEIAIGIVAKGVPQLNIFTIGLPLRIVVGSLAFTVTLPVFISLMRRVINGIPVELHGLLQLMRP